MKFFAKFKMIFLCSFLLISLGVGSLYIFQDSKIIKIFSIKTKAYLGNSEAERMLGYYYMVGENENKNMEKAIYWLERSSKHNNDEAMMLLGHIYENENPKNKKITKANDLYLKAAKHGNVLGQYYVGNMYYYGKNVTQDKVKALAWYACSTIQQGENEVTFQSILVELLPKDMTILEVEKAKVLAKYYFNLYVKPFNKGVNNINIDEKLAELISLEFPVEKNQEQNIKF